MRWCGVLFVSGGGSIGAASTGSSRRQTMGDLSRYRPAQVIRGVRGTSSEICENSAAIKIYSQDHEIKERLILCQGGTAAYFHRDPRPSLLIVIGPACKRLDEPLRPGMFDKIPGQLF